LEQIPVKKAHAEFVLSLPNANACGYTTRMQVVQYCITTILLTVALVMILLPASASDNSPACTAENALKDLTISSAATVFAAGLLPGFNPCPLAMLAFLASTMLPSTGHRIGTFVVYIIFGVGLFSAYRKSPLPLCCALFWQLSLLVLGLMQLEDARRLQTGGASLFRTNWTKKYVHDVIANRRLSSYFLLGALFSLVRAPCVAGVYNSIIGTISSQGYASSGLLYLMIYNLGIVLPVLLLGGIISSGKSPEQVDHFRQKHRVAIG
jgi:cytochrome c-type biogenesis protein